MEYISQQYLDNLKELYNVLCRCWRAGYKFNKIREEVHSVFGESMFTDEEIKEHFRFMWGRELSLRV